MKLSQLIASIPQGTDPEIIVLRDWGELAPLHVLTASDLADGDPVIELIAAAGDSVILVASPEL